MSRHRKQRQRKKRQRQYAIEAVNRRLDEICLQEGKWPFEHMKVSEIAGKFADTGIKRTRLRVIIYEYTQKCNFKVVHERAF